AGSRSGGITAATWAAMVALGEEGYLDAARRIMTAADTIKAGIARIPELRILGKRTFCIAIASDTLEIFHVNDFLAKRGWRLNGLQTPPGVHMCVTLPQGKPGVAERFVEDLKAAVEFAKNPPETPPMSSAVYGGGPAVDRSWINELLLAMLDETYEL